MFRLQRALRARPSPHLLAASKQSGRATSRFFTNGVQVEGRQVRLVSPLFTPRKLATFALYSVCVGGYLWWVSPEVEIEVTTVGDESHGEGSPAVGGEGEEDEWSEEDSWFIPLTWAKQLPREYYKGSDPEWEEFRKIAKDQGKLKRVYGKDKVPHESRLVVDKIADELVSVVVAGVTQHPALARAMGKDPQVGKVWLDVTFPDGPPQEYSRKGIEIADEYIAISEQRLTQEEYHRTMRLIWPTGMVNSLYAYIQTMWTFQSQKFRAALGIDTKAQPGSPEYRVNHMLQILQAQQSGNQARTLGKTQTDPGSVGSSAQAGSGMESTTADQAARSPTADASSTDDNRWYMPSMKKSGGQEAEHTIAAAMFAHTLQKSWTHTTREPPRGTCVVTGLVQMKGQRGIVTLDIQAFYDPKAGKFTAINVSPKLLKKRNQAPRGGP